MTGGGPPAPRLLEREEVLGTLERWLSASAQHGRLVLIEGEAGLGKTSLARALVASASDTVTVLWGACDGLRAPRPLGPLLDFAAADDGPLGTALRAHEKPAVCFAALLSELNRRAPALLVIEDLHWADEATLDVVTMLGRRAQEAPGLTVVTLRDELGSSPRMRTVVGELGAAAGVRRMRLSPLSPAAVGHLAAPSGADPEALHRLTGGNPFFVREVLAAAGAAMPVTVRDAVLGRLQRLTPAARSALEVLAAAPYPIQVELAEALLGDAVADLREPLDAGVLVSRGTTIAFRHELVRQAIEETMDALRAVPIHRRYVASLSAIGQVDPAWVVHHAEAAGDGAVVRSAGLAAAQQAAEAGAHREAIAQYDRVLRFAGELAPGERIALREGQADELHLVAEFDAELAALGAALDDARRAADRLREGTLLRKRSGPLYCKGDAAGAEAAALAAITVLEELSSSGDSDAGAELAAAYGAMCSRSMNAENAEGALHWGAKAAALAERAASLGLRIAALNDLGTVNYLQEREAGRAQLQESLALAVTHGLDEHAGRAYINLCWVATRIRQYDRALEDLASGIAYCTARDLETHRQYLLAYRSRIELDRGRWDEAAETSREVLDDQRIVPHARAVALTVLGLVRARRGDPGALAPLEQALILCAGGNLQRIGPVACARAEALWLAGRATEVDAATAPALEHAISCQAPWVAGELAVWRRRAGIPGDAGTDAAGPYAQSLAGRAQEAAEAWRALGCEYEAALALADCEDDALGRHALDQLTALGARPAATLVARTLRGRGARQLPRGPRRTTRAHPAGLTSRQSEVLTLLAQGLRNAEIAERLVVSEKTVEHHVSAILHKLGAQTRGEAVARARELDPAAPA